MIALLFCSWLLPLASTKEVVATKEWTLLGDNDTVAAGMHVRVDLQTGEKWVKYPDDHDGDGTYDQTGSAAVVVVNGEVRQYDASARDGKLRGKDSLPVLKGVAGGSVPPYDFEMMHRTLGQLPPEEKERMGLPDPPDSGMTVEQRKNWEERMKAIWDRRQEELKRFEEEFVADLPQILRDRIDRLKLYINEPYKELAEMNLGDDAAAVTARDRGGENVGEEDSAVVTHIVSVLADLEYHLADIDMTRDFYTLGGWPLLVSLLLDDTHRRGGGPLFSVNGTEGGLSEDALRNNIHAVQAHAAWAMGTAVKNTGEFAPYVVETLALVDRRTSALKVLVDQISAVDVTDTTKPAQDKLYKYLYALGSFLRGNPLAQNRFAAYGGGAALERLLEAAVPNIELNTKSRKMVQRILSIADDVLAEIAERSREDSDTTALAQGFSSTVWCESVLMALRTRSPLQPLALRTCRSQAPLCLQSSGEAWSASVREGAEELAVQWRAEVADAEDADDGAQERVDLAQSVVAILTVQ
jgi:hypothetical protein